MLETKNLHLSISDYLRLVKFRLSLAITFSATTGYLISGRLPGSDFFLLVAGIFLLTCGSAALNQYTERAQDALMKRTQNRPVAAKKIPAKSAVIISAFLTTTGSILLIMTGFLPFLLGCAGVILYNIVYTSLKKITPLAIIPGALVGSVPPLIGYASSGTATFNNKILFLAVFMFLWQIPHFLMLLLRYGKEYKDARFRTVYDHLDEHQIKTVISVWVALASLCLVIVAWLEGIFISIPAWIFVIATVLFVPLIFISLTRTEHQVSIKNPFMLLNLYSFIFMLFLITDSFLYALKSGG